MFEAEARETLVKNELLFSRWFTAQRLERKIYTFRCFPSARLQRLIYTSAMIVSLHIPTSIVLFEECFAHTNHFLVI